MSDFFVIAHVLFFILQYRVKYMLTVWLRVLHCGLGLAYNWLVHPELTVQQLLL